MGRITILIPLGLALIFGLVWALYNAFGKKPEMPKPKPVSEARASSSRGDAPQVMQSAFYSVDHRLSAAVPVTSSGLLVTPGKVVGEGVVIDSGGVLKAVGSEGRITPLVTTRGVDERRDINVRGKVTLEDGRVETVFSFEGRRYSLGRHVAEGVVESITESEVIIRRADRSALVLSYAFGAKVAGAGALAPSAVVSPDLAGSALKP